jgi:hypothetical protein
MSVDDVRATSARPYPERVVRQQGVELLLGLHEALFVNSVNQEHDGVHLGVVVLPHAARPETGPGNNIGRTILKACMKAGSKSSSLLLTLTLASSHVFSTVRERPGQGRGCGDCVWVDWYTASDQPENQSVSAPPPLRARPGQTP